MRRAILLLMIFSAPAFGQASRRGRPCSLEVLGTQTTLSLRPLASGRSQVFFGRGYRARCAGTNMLLASDSAEFNEDTRIATLIGNARYAEDSTTINANTMQYFESESRVMAIGDVRVRMRNGSTLNIANLTYNRPTPARNYTTAEGFGRARLVLRDSVRAPETDVTVIESLRLRMERDSLFYAGGDVVITRTDVIAKADSAITSSGRSRMRLLTGTPKLTGLGKSPFTVEGVIIDVFGKEKAINRLLAQGNAVAVSDSMRLTADTIDIGTTNGAMDRIALRGPGRARAVAPDRDIIANRIDLSMPGQKLERLTAIGRAHIETRPDSAVKSPDRDWIEGDTVIATFEQVAPNDTSKQPPLRAIVSRTNARSYYQIASKNVADPRPTINYVTGLTINIAFAKGQAQTVRVDGDVRGISLEPARTDTTAVRRPPPTIPPRAP